MEKELAQKVCSRASDPFGHLGSSCAVLCGIAVAPCPSQGVRKWVIYPSTSRKPLLQKEVMRGWNLGAMAVLEKCLRLGVGALPLDRIVGGTEIPSLGPDGTRDQREALPHLPGSSKPPFPSDPCTALGSQKGPAPDKVEIDFLILLVRDGSNLRIGRI